MPKEISSCDDGYVDIPEDLMYRILNVVHAVAALGQEANIQAEAVHIWSDLMNLVAASDEESNEEVSDELD